MHKHKADDDILSQSTGNF